MSIFLKWLIRVLISFCLLVLVIAIISYNLALRSLPNYNQTLVSDKIDSKIEIIRDSSNIPHIFSDGINDVFFGLGYAHAQDRFWQLNILRRSAQGRLSEIFGQKTLQFDEFIRRLDIYNLARLSLSNQSEQTKLILKAYSDGINARVKEINTKALGRGAPEMFLYPSEFSYWQPADSIAIFKLLALKMSGHIDAEVTYAKASLAMEDQHLLSALLPYAPGKIITRIPYLEEVSSENFSNSNSNEKLKALFRLPNLELAGASNVFGATKERSAANGALIANDPHFDLSVPSLFYLARLQLDEGAVIGASVPGTPIILSGRNEKLAWGITASYLDDQDIFIEEQNLSDPNLYRTENGWADFKTDEQYIKVKNSLDVKIKRFWTKNGPILPNSVFDLSSITPKNHLSALSWTGLAETDTTISSAINLMLSKNVKQGLVALEDFYAPSLNFLLVDKQNMILKTAGKMPRRSHLNNTQGRMPSLGWKSENNWRGFWGFEANPIIISSPGDILGNTNNKITDQKFPKHVSHFWGDNQRILRWQKLMQNREVHTRESFIEAQLDTVSPTARSLLPLVGSELWYSQPMGEVDSKQRLRFDAISMLASWNGEMNEHLPEPLIYSTWMKFLQKRLIEDDLGPVSLRFSSINPIFIEKVFRDIDGASNWCDIKHSKNRESCPEIASNSLDEALFWLQEKYGKNLNALRWGDAHEAFHRNETLGDIPVLKYLVNIRQSSSGGDNTLMRGKSLGKGDEPFLNIHSAVYRGVYDFADPDSSVFIISTGQSGHFLSRHYDDLGNLWRRGEYVPMSLDPNLARAASIGKTIISPKSSQRTKE
jgi:penicillin amidase